MKLNLTVNRVKPRNPLIAAARRSGAGLHRDTRPMRQALRALRDELARLDHERHQT